MMDAFAALAPLLLVAAEVVGLVGIVLTSSLLAALVTAAVALHLARSRSREEERARVRTMLAEAYQWCAAYKEFPYAVRRRRADMAEAERQRLSEAMRAVQEKLSFFLLWTAAENREVGAAYAALVDQLRRVAGSAIHQAWMEPPIDNDAEMNISPEVVDLSLLAQSEKAYRDAVVSFLRSA